MSRKDGRGKAPKVPAEELTNKRKWLDVEGRRYPYIGGLAYKIGLHGRVFYWDGSEWRRSEEQEPEFRLYVWESWRGLAKRAPEERR